MRDNRKHARHRVIQALTGLTIGNYVDAEMVRSFIPSPEYRARFGQP